MNVLQKYSAQNEQTETSVNRTGFKPAVPSNSWLLVIPVLITDGYFNCRSLVPIPAGRNYSAFNYKLIFHLSTCCPTPRPVLARVDCIAVVGTAMGNPVCLLPGRQLITQLLHVTILSSNPPTPTPPPPPPHLHLLIAMVINRTVDYNNVTRHLDKRTCSAATLDRQTDCTHISRQRRDRPTEVLVLCSP